jgi:rhamnosyl/mannosyltransferase
MSGISARLVIIGTGPLESDLKELAMSLGIRNRVSFLGRIEESELINYYAACTLLALPSVSQTECYGLVQAEAMMSGKAVVNTNLPTGVPWISLHEQTGLTVPPGDVEALRDAINRLLSNQTWREDLGNAAKIRAQQHFTLPAHCQAMENLYASLLAK